MANDLEGDAVPRCLNKSSSDNPISDPKHKIFLSHSGGQKGFVDLLCNALEVWKYKPFFDRREKSLPKGEQFPELIIQAAEQCEMLIVVVSNDYFMSKWPMIELNAFVKAHKLSPRAKCPQDGPQILPLFYKLSAGDLKHKTMRKKWHKCWEKLAEDRENGIVVEDWKVALDVLKSFNGFEYNQKTNELVAYVDKIVNHVCKSIIPDSKWDDSHVQGKSGICKVICEEIERIQVSEKYNCKVVGLYGVGGIGKTTACKILSNELLNAYGGRVCHLEFPNVLSKDSIGSLQKALLDATRTSTTVKDDKWEYAWCASRRKQKVFLAIDNVYDVFEAKKRARMFLEAPYHKESLVIVTARSKSILEQLDIDGDSCVEMPELDEEDAMKLFLHHTTCGKELFKAEDKGYILQCIQMCYFSKGAGKDYGSHYHPLALEALGLQLGFRGANPSEWVKHLPTFKTFSSFAETTNRVFDILRSSFDLLPPLERQLFMDVVFFERHRHYHFLVNDDAKFIDISRMEWLCDLHRENQDEISRRLKNLKRTGLLQDVDLTTGETNMHDLYIEFAELEAKDAFIKSEDLEERKWVVVDDGNLTKLEKAPGGKCWPKLTHLAIEQHFSATEEGVKLVGQTPSLEGIRWKYFCNIEVLRLEGMDWGGGTLNLQRLRNLRVLYLFQTKKLGKLKGLRKLKNLTQFYWTSMTGGSKFVGRLPSSLKTLCIVGRHGKHVVLGSNLLARCFNLSKLHLFHVKVNKLDLSNCGSLKSVHLFGISKLQTLSGFTARRHSNLQSLLIDDCENLIDIPGMDQLTGLEKLSIWCCFRLEVRGQFATIKVRDLESRSRREVQGLVVGGHVSIPCQLREFSFTSNRFVVRVHLNGFNQLEVLDLSGSRRLTSLKGLEELPALRRLKLIDCRKLSQLPDLSKSRKLKDLDLTGCDVLKLHEEDIQMLSKLPLLQPVFFSRWLFSQYFKLDFVRRKALIHSCKPGHSISSFPSEWEKHKWEERDLVAPLLEIAQLEEQEVTATQIENVLSHFGAFDAN